MTETCKLKHLLKYILLILLYTRIADGRRRYLHKGFGGKDPLSLCSRKLELAAGMIQNLSQVLSLAGSETRLKLLYLLEQGGELCVCDLSDVLGITMPAVSQQLQKLKYGNIIQSKKVGQTIFYSLKRENLEVIRPLFQYNYIKTACSLEEVT